MKTACDLEKLEYAECMFEFRASLSQICISMNHAALVEPGRCGIHLSGASGTALCTKVEQFVRLKAQQDGRKMSGFEGWRSEITVHLEESLCLS